MRALRAAISAVLDGEIRLDALLASLPAAERARLHAEADRMSKRIYRQKHDAQTRGN